MDPEEFQHLPRCVECKRAVVELEVVLLFPCHFCLICLPCVHYFLAIRQTRKCAMCGEEVALRGLAVDDKLTSLAALLRYSHSLNDAPKQQWMAHYATALEQYANERFPSHSHRFTTSPGLADFSERAAIDLEKQPEMTEKGWICESCGAKSPFQAWRCVQCQSINFAWHSLVTGEEFLFPTELTELLKFREVKTVSSQK